MKKIEEFKAFVREKPSLIYYVRNNEMSWQKFYEIWDLYGPNHEIWQRYSQYNDSKPVASSTVGKDIMGMLKNIDMETVRQGISGLQKAIGLVQELIKKDNSNKIEMREPYRPRPMFRRFED